MKSTIGLTYILVFCVQVVLAQSPILVADFNEGEESSFDFQTQDGENYFGELKAINFQSKLFFPLFSPSLGEELGILEGNEIRVLKDISPGFWSSKPKHFIKYKGKLYFTARDDMGSALFRTDGTEEGTVLVFRPPTNDATSELSELYVTDQGLMYFTRSAKLYVYDGNEARYIFDGIAFENNVCKYKEGLAFVNSFFDLYYISDEDIVNLADFNGFGKVHTLAAIQEGLYIGIGKVSEPKRFSDFVYLETGNEIFQLGTESEHRIMTGAVDNGQILRWRQGVGYFLFDGINDELIYTNTSTMSGSLVERIPSISYNGNLIFEANDWPIDRDMVFSDGTEPGSSAQIEIEYDLSNMLFQSGYAFFATGISNYNYAKLYYYDLENGSYENFYTYEIRSQSRSILLMGIINGRLYYVSGHDEDVGYELYTLNSMLSQIRRTLP